MDGCCWAIAIFRAVSQSRLLTLGTVSSCKFDSGMMASDRGVIEDPVLFLG